jgi:hypothetical protein
MSESVRPTQLDKIAALPAAAAEPRILRMARRLLIG